MENQQKKPQNPSAYPSWDMTFTENPNSNLFSAGTSQGMTLRDYFAAKAMQGIISTYNSPLTIKQQNISHPNELSQLSYSIADEMLKQREKE